MFFFFSFLDCEQFAKINQSTPHERKNVLKSVKLPAVLQTGEDVAPNGIKYDNADEKLKHILH